MRPVQPPEPEPARDGDEQAPLGSWAPAGGFPPVDPPDLPPLDRLGLRDDIAARERYAAEHADRLRHVSVFSPSWMVHDGERWVLDHAGEHVQLAMVTADRLLVEARDRDPAWIKWAISIRQLARIRAMTTLAASHPRIAAQPGDFDRDPWVLNCRNGTADLRTGRLRPHDPADMLTMLAGGAYRADAECPIWDATLTRIQPRAAMRAFLQRLAGCSAIGQVVEQILAILHGSGANGKTTFINAVRTALGDYAHAAPLVLLTSTARAGQATPELADLRGRRLVTVAESPEDGALSVERVKALTGGDAINARHLNCNPFTFTPTHTPWLATNHRPRVGDEGDAIWRRLLLIPFDVVIPEAEWDRGLDDKLAAEADGILRWVIDGALEYQRRGLDPPETVLAATSDYREAELTVGAWVDECLILDPNAWTSNGDLLCSYLAWAHENGADELSTRAIGERLALIDGLERKQIGRRGRGWQGVMVRPSTNSGREA